MGEGAGNDALIMPFISSANIACGYHAGDEDTIKKTVELALKYNVAIGAHPGFEDKENFGRLEMHLPLEEVYDIVTKQIDIIKKVCAEFNTNLHHVKPHGALYNMAAKDEALAAAIAKAVKDADENLILYGLNNSFMITAAKEMNLKTANEVFADRRYNNDGSLVSRKLPTALIEGEEEMLQQLLQMVLHNTVASVEGATISLDAQTICIHGDGKNAARFAKKIYETLGDNNIFLRTI